MPKKVEEASFKTAQNYRMLQRLKQAVEHELSEGQPEPGNPLRFILSLSPEDLQRAQEICQARLTWKIPPLEQSKPQQQLQRLQEDPLPSSKNHARQALLEATLGLLEGFDFTRYEREEGWRDGVLLNLFWGRYRSLWKPRRGTGALSLRSQELSQRILELKRRITQSQHIQARNKQMEKEQQEIARLGRERYNQRMLRQKQESEQRKAQEVMTEAKRRRDPQYQRFLDWREKPETRALYEQPDVQAPLTHLPRASGPAPRAKSSQSLILASSSELNQLFVRLLQEFEILGRPKVSCRSINGDASTIPYTCVATTKELSHLKGCSRKALNFSAEISHFYTRGARTVFCLDDEALFAYSLFPPEYKRYEGLPAPLGNPKKTARMQVMLDLSGCLSQFEVLLKIKGQRQRCVAQLGSLRSLSPEEAFQLLLHSEDPLKQAVEEARRERETLREQAREEARREGQRRQQEALNSGLKEKLPQPKQAQKSLEEKRQVLEALLRQGHIDQAQYEELWSEALAHFVKR